MVENKPPNRTSPRRPTLSDVFDHAVGHAAMLRQRVSTRRSDYNSYNPVPSHNPVPWPGAAFRLAVLFGEAPDSILGENALLDIEARTRRVLSDIRPDDPFPNRWAADALVSRCCYLACRLVKPRVVVETGVAYGVSSAFILAALRENGGGVLHSVDLLPLRRRASRFQGIAVPDGDLPNWTLHHGSSRRVLPDLLTRLGGVDVFFHDSLHTRANMRFEFDLALRRLRPGGVLIADDIERNDAFPDFLRGIGGHSSVVSDRETAPLHGKAAPTVFGIVVPEPPPPV